MEWCGAERGMSGSIENERQIEKEVKEWSGQDRQLRRRKPQSYRVHIFENEVSSTIFGSPTATK